MAKEKLKFKIQGKSIVYEGYPDNRPKDLMEILAKLGVKDEVVVPTFRENIEDNGSHSDENILNLFAAAKQARAEKKRLKAEGNSGAAASGGEASPDPDKPQRITLRFRGKQFSYEGLLSGKRNALVQLLLKQKDLTREQAVEAFRDNLPDYEGTDDDIWKLVQDTKEAKERARASKMASSESGEGHNGRSSAEPRHGGDELVGGGAGGALGSSTADYDALDDIPGLSRAERDDLSNFIKQVLEQPPMEFPDKLEKPPRETKSSIQAAAKEEAEMQLTARTSGKFVVYCQEDNTNVTKLVHVTGTMRFDEFYSIIEKKFGRKMALYFYEGDDVIELDDDDVLAMFIEQTMNIDPKKVRLHCTALENRKRPDTSDRLLDSMNASTANTDTRVMTNKVVAYSNGDLTVRELRSYSGHSMAVYSCAFSPKGDQFVSVSRDHSVRVWNVRTGSCTVMKGGHNGFVLSCDFSPKGNRVVSSSDDCSIKVWNTGNGSKVASLKGHDDKVYCVAYSPRGDYIASASCDHTVRVWNADSGSRVTTLKGHTLAVFSCCFSSKDGKYICSGSDDRLIKIWGWEEGKEVRSLVGHIGTVWSVKYSHNDLYIVSSSMDHELKLWDARNGNCLRNMMAHEKPIHHAVFSSDDRYLLSASRDWSIMVFRTEDGTHVETIVGHLNTVYHLDTHGDKLLSCSLDASLKMWEITENQRDADEVAAA